MIKLAIEEEKQEERDAISMSLIPDSIHYPISLKFPNGNAFKLAERCFNSLKLENLIFRFDFRNDDHKFSIESDEDDDTSDILKVNINKF